MKTIFLLSLFILLFSCAHNSKRYPANLSSEDLVSKYFEESARYLLSYEPKKFGSFSELIKSEKEEEFYKILGQIDLDKMKPIHSRFMGKEDRYKNLFITNRVRQISYLKWKELSQEVSEAFLRGRYVFKKGDFYFTLSGLKLSASNINPRIFHGVKRFNSQFNFDELVLSIFNRETIFPLGNHRAIVLPTGRIVHSQSLAAIGEDFKEQVGDEISLAPVELINFSPKKAFEERRGYRILRNDRYQDFLNDRSFIDSKSACETKFYYRSLSRRPEANKFIKTLLRHKVALMQELQLSNREYDELLVLSLGILSVESKMGRSLKYKIKEDLRIGKLNFGQFAIKLVKRLKGRSDENSRGLTQIKNIGPLLEDTSYSYLEHSNLDDPENAALATMFVLKEKLGYLRHFSSRHSNINEENWSDYLYYFYQGSSSQITKGLATPPLNLRIQKILEIKDESIVFSDCD